MHCVRGDTNTVNKFSNKKINSSIMTATELLAAYASGERDFSGANLRNADLSGANFSGANFSGANFSGAKLTNADFSGANLRYAIGI